MSDTPTPRPYDLFDAADPGGPFAAPAGNSYLVTAPLPAGRRFVLDVLGRGVREGEGAMVVTTDEPAGAIADALGERAADDADCLRIIDCQTGTVELGGSATLVQNVDTPRNLTDIGIGFTNAIDGFEDAGIDRVRFGMLSLSVVLSYVDQETVYRFCETLTRGLAGEDYVGLFALNVDAHDEKTINTLRRAFDGRIDVRADAGGERPEIRAEGIEGIPGEWTGYDA